MKEAKLKPGTTASRPKASSLTTNPPLSKPGASHAQAQKPMIPAGFFDDSLADAKARNVDVQQLAEKQLESDWAAFQEFAVEVEKQSAKEEQVRAEETKEREAVEQLENMQYVDRYRLALERVTSLRNGEKRKAEKRTIEDLMDGMVGEDDEEEDSHAAVVAVNEYKKKQKNLKKQYQSISEESDDLDLCNWRSRGI